MTLRMWDTKDRVGNSLSCFGSPHGGPLAHNLISWNSFLKLETSFAEERCDLAYNDLEHRCISGHACEELLVRIN